MFVIFGMQGGGAQRVVARILALLDRNRFSPSLVLFQGKGAFLSLIPPDVTVLDCGRYGHGGRLAWFGNFVRFCRREDPALIVSFLWFSNLVTILARAVAGIHAGLVVSERLSVSGAREGFLEDVARRIGIFFLYRVADRVTPNSDATREQLVGRYHLSPRKVIAIPNPLDINSIVSRSLEKDALRIGENTPPAIVAMGRLVWQKGFDTLLRSLPGIKHPCRLLILGEGEDEDALRALSSKLGVDNRVSFTGFLSNPYPTLSAASVFVLSSRFEGFPNALLEAMSLGVPSVSTRCPSGPEEIITDGVNGFLVPVEDPVALAGAIDRLLGDPELRSKMGCAGRESVQTLDAPNIVRRYEALFEEVAR
jgi:glycosyltransferase involved in cell wall biosynthesis